MKTICVGIPSADIAGIWPHVERLIELACGRSSGRWDAQTVRERLSNAEMQLWVACDEKGAHIEGVCVTEIVRYSSGRKAASVVICTGRERENWVSHIEAIEAWAKEAGCDMIEMWARPGWEKDLPSYKRTHVLLEKRLDV